ncbi:glycoside hydrolase family 2 TIM barrel-domain containing protein [Paenibacillus sp. CAU 1782]
MPVDLPHDWLIYDTLNLYENSIGWYRKRFVCEEADSLLQGKLNQSGTSLRRFLSFDGVYMDSMLYVNGQWVGEWKYGYSSFEFDISDALRVGDNELLLKVVHQSPNSRWYSGAGIYRNVWLKERGSHYIETDGVYFTVSQEGDGDGWRVDIDTELKSAISEIEPKLAGLHTSDRGVSEKGTSSATPFSAEAMPFNAEATPFSAEVKPFNADGKPFSAEEPEPGVVALVVSHRILHGEEVVASVTERLAASKNGDIGEGADQTAGIKRNEVEASQLADRRSNEGDSGQIADEGSTGDAEPYTGADRTASEPNLLRSKQSIVVRNPLLWSTDEPNVYRLQTTLQVIRLDEAGSEWSETVETVTQNIGFRSILLDPARGMELNGKPFKINGVCEHHDLGALGAAFNKEAVRWRLGLLKEMGVNGIRTAHNMPASELMGLADEMGFLVVSEAFDMWERPKTPFDYARFFKEWMPRDVESWVRRDRNHPSLLMWSIGNEIYDTHADERGQEVTRLLLAKVLKHDPRGNAPATIGSNYMPWENARKCADIVKLAGYNYAEKYYEAHHTQHPDWIIYGSETASVVQSRGIYHFPFEAAILADDDEQCSALGNSTTSWGAKSPEACIIAERDTPFSLGQFLWTGFDYIGEPTPYHTKNSYFGQIDTAGFAKDPYYIYQASWTDYKSKPMIHLLPYWDFNEGQTIDVRVCSNAPRVELQFNGETVGVHDIDHAGGTQLVGWWKLPYRKGELKAIAYDENGAVIATTAKRSFGDASRIVLTPSKTCLVADGTDLIFVEISMEDEQGNVVENATNRVEVNVTGPGRLVGLDNGDSTDYDPYKGISRRLFSGKLMAIIAATLEPGDIRMEVASTGLESCLAEFAALPGEGGSAEGISAVTRNGELPLALGSKDEIPLRKLEIVSATGQYFDEKSREKTVSVRLYPENTTYRDVEWSVVNDAGILSTIAKAEANGHEVKLTALGDGEFRLRCMSRNGGEGIRLISQLEFQATGLGTAYKDPYGFISAGLYDDYRGDLGSGNERGVATSRDGDTAVGFRDIDFGPYGSDTVTLPIFALSDESYSLQMWEGEPGAQESELLADVIYQKPSIWNVYQEETYRLSRRLRGIASLWLVTKQKLHIKGFSFQRQNRGLALNYAAENDGIYGDAFVVKERFVEGIGNNVSLEFAGLDFEAEGVTKLVLYGHSPIDKNTIHIQFSGIEGEGRQLVEFTHSDGYEERVLALDNIAGEQKVTFIFLPGSSFNFGWFRFER